MTGKKKFVAGVALGMLLSVTAFAAQDAPLNASGRAAILKTLAVEMKANYIEPAVADRVALAIAKKDGQGGYTSATTAQAFSAALAKDLRALSGDLHFTARFDERFRDGNHAEAEDAGVKAVRSGYGIEKIERLPGNVGYIELRGFGPSKLVGPAYTAAMSLLAGADALILDLRRNAGEAPPALPI